MKFPAILSNAAAFVALVLSVWLFVVNQSNRGLQSELQKRQDEIQTKQQAVQLQQQQLQAQQQQINAGIQLAQEVGPAVLRDLGTLQIQNKNEKIKELLKKYGVEIKESADAANAQKPAAGTPAPK